MNSNTIKVYIASYKGKNICLSDDKLKVKCYMETHRKLDPEEYEIIKEYIHEANLVTNYSDITIEEYYNWFIPNIDIMMIELFGIDVRSKISNTLGDFQHLTYLICMMKSSTEEEKGILISAINILKDHIKDKRKLKKLEKENLRNNPIFYFNMETYLDYLRSFKEQRELNSTWTYNVTKDDDVEDF